MRSLNLTVTSPIQTFTEPVTLAEVKKRINLPERSPADGEEDAQLEMFIAKAREIAEVCQDRDFVEKQWDLSMDSFEEHCIELRDGLVTVDLVRYRDSDGAYTTLVEDTDYIVDTAKRPGIVLPMYGESWPSFTAWPSSAVLIRFTTGPRMDFTADYKNRIKSGILYLCSHWFNVGLPFEMGSKDGLNEYAWTVKQCFELGAIPRVF